MLQNLKKSDLSGKPDPFVLITLLGAAASQQQEWKTKTIKNQPDPVWNETFKLAVSTV